MSIPPILSTAGLARLLGVTDRTIRRRLEAGEFPPGSVHYSKGGRARILTARLIAAGWLSAEAAQAVSP